MSTIPAKPKEKTSQFDTLLVRKKTETAHLWDIERTDSETVIGSVKAHYKSPSQRTWEGKIEFEGKIYTAEGEKSIKKFMANLEAQVVAAAATVISTNAPSDSPATSTTNNVTEKTL